MALVSSKVFADEFSPECRPDRRTIIGWVRDGFIEGAVIGKKCYVDIDAFRRLKKSSISKAQDAQHAQDQAFEKRIQQTLKVTPSTNVARHLTDEDA